MNEHYEALVKTLKGFRPGTPAVTEGIIHFMDNYLPGMKPELKDEVVEWSFMAEILGVFEKLKKDLE